MLRRIKMTSTAVSSVYGSLGQDDILSIDSDYADHLVNECHAAVFLDAVKPEIVKPVKKKAK